MAKDQQNVFDLVPLLGSTDLHKLEQVKNLLQETLSADKGTMLLWNIVEYFLETSSSQAVDILSSVREPHDKYLLDKMNECMGKQSCRLATITLLGHIVRKQPPWIHKIARFPLLASLLKCLKTDSDVVVLITGVLVLIALLPMIPQNSKQLLCEYFDIFGRLAAWNQRHPGQAQGVFAVHLHASVYSLFHRLYGMYPCNFVSYLRSHYSMKENVDTFEEVVKPMLQYVRIHPELITGNKDYEVDAIRWKRFEPHDIVVECAKISLDSKEASSEVGYSSLSDHIPRRPVEQSRSCSELSIHEITSVTPRAVVHQSLFLSLPYLTVTQDSGSSAQTPNHQTDGMNSSGTKEEMWSPSSVCGMTTPPNSRGMSPTTVSDVSHSASQLSGRVPSTPGDGKWTLSPSTPSGSSPLPSLSEEIGQPAQNTSCTHAKGIHTGKDLKKVAPISINNNGCASDAKTPVSLEQLSDIVKRTDGEREDDTIDEEILSLTNGRLEFGMRPGLDSSFSGSLDTLLSSHPSHEQNLVSTPDRVEFFAKGGEQQPWSLWPAFTPIGNGKCSKCSLSDLTIESMPYELLFDLALPKVASLFLERKTTEAIQRADEEGEHREELKGEDLSTTSPLEVLDRVIQQGHDTHEKVLKTTLSSQSQSPDPHSGGKQHSNKGKGPVSTESDELGMLRSQLLLLHNQLLYERHKREQHALRNRRLFGRIVNATALEEQNNSMKTQLKLQDIEIQAVQVSLKEEQRRSRHIQEDRDALVNQLQTQIQQLQKERNDYYSKMQELKSDLQENQKKVREMEAELQKANNKMCNMGHMLSQLSIKLNNSENIEQQMAFLNKQLLLLGEANKLCVEEIDRLGPEASKELNMLQSSSLHEAERLRQSSLQQSQRLEAAQQRITDLETQHTKKEQVIREQKKLLENVKCQATEQLQASENRYLAQKHITQALQSDLLELYCQLELKNLNNKSPAEPTSELNSPTKQRQNGNSTGPSAPFLSTNPMKKDEGMDVCVNGEISAGSPQTSTALINGSQEEDLSALTHSFPALSFDSSLAVNSYPSTGSFLGKIAREMFRNKSESHYEGEPAAFTCLSKDLMVEPVTEPTESMKLEEATVQADLQPIDRPLAYNIQRKRQQDLKIMDYNETQQEH
ncbi:hamartin-like isoform X1 [Carassius gibelio]|uniref:hamartin-like isoform X1 n=1 Tax=Carassius gibelio TaxID=101364 RepID=UPI0022783EEF|nr:hamartin-like isoform X1 [Carassius gibelio]XP_052448861.1 hamartin-like isoform X1 [Carassius gibelio]XP_052448862.1 hamartin-like isoform X1 [Carassius gibelio]XP_052448863.1 hamartin-like isoform X1 [Carassius gibelio]XP_052448864.1 hamartin-like isoform X1 [Carassius gibelio]XP_052448865.1 hamartin-like isoform X1 [Carassius gibelio]